MTLRSATPGPRGLSEDQIAGEPMAPVARWMYDALAWGMPEPTAMVLSSITAEGGPRARTVLLKAHDQAGFTFYSNRTSRKGRELAANPAACLVFPWYGIQRQVIVGGAVAELEQRGPEPGPIPMPDFWGGYLLEPDAVEFWQAGAFRLHDRLRYRRVDDGWAVDRLSPWRPPADERR